MGGKRHRVCWTKNKRQLMVLAYPLGCRPRVDSPMLPSTVGLAQIAPDAFRYLTARRGRWVVEIRDPNSGDVFATCTMSNEPSAMALLDPAKDELAKLHQVDAIAADRALGVA